MWWMGLASTKIRFGKVISESWSAELSAEAPAKKPAEMYTVAMVLSLELVVVDTHAPVFQRALAWVVLCMTWGAMRCDDVQAVFATQVNFVELRAQAGTGEVQDNWAR